MKLSSLKFNWVLACFLLIGFASQAQTLNLSDPLPEDQRVRKGVLENGMTYYIYHSDVTQNAASYYIIQNVGSVLENDNQKGLAHFLEHMAFNGTENFEGKGILNTLEKYGAVFGKDINAYTSFDETVYNLNNIPTSDGLVDTCLLVLKDWSNYLLLTDEEIDAERGVIKEEWRTRQSGQMRIIQQNLPTMFGNSKYGERIPIGDMDIIENFEYKALRDFYHDWYRTDLQAIAIIGDIDVDEIESKIKASFSEIPAVTNGPERYTVQIDDNEEMAYAIAMDEEVTTSNISFSINHPRSLKDQTVKDLKESLLHGMATSMMSARLREKSQDPEAAFVQARVSYGGFVRAKNQFSVAVYPKPNMQHTAFKDVMTEVYRAVKFGFTPAEIERIVAEYTTSYETQISKLDDKSHGAIARNIQQNYLENETLTDITGEFELAKVIFASLTPEEVHASFKALYTPNNRTIVVTGVEGNNNLSKEDGAGILAAVENDASLTAYEDAFSGKTLTDGITITAGSIVNSKNNEEIRSTTYTLSNGVVVHYKFANKNANDVKLSARSYGGTSLLAEEMYPAASLVGALVQFSGLGDYSMTELQKVLAGKTASTNISVSGTGESISGSSTTKDLETMLQMVHLNFEKPRFDENGHKVLMENIDNYLIRRSENINEKMGDSITTTLYGKNHPTRRIFNKEYAADMTFERMKAVYLDRFENAADFEFFIVGDVEASTLEPLLETYLASIQTTSEKESFKDNSTTWINANIDKDIFLKMEDPKASVRVLYKNAVPHNLKNELLASAMGDILTLRFTETLREDEGGTYGASAGAYLNKRPQEEAILSVSFDCNPDKVEKLTAIVQEEIVKIAKGEINQEDLDKTLTNYLKEREQSKDYNRYDMNLLLNFYREGYNMNKPSNFEDIVNSIKIKDVAAFAEALLKNANSYEIVFKPEAAPEVGANITKESVLNKYVEAIGGEKIKSVTTLLAKGSASMQGMELEMLTKSMAPNKTMVQMSGMGMVLSKQAFNGTTGYFEQQGQRGEMTLEQVEESKKSSVPFSELDYLKNETVEFAGAVSINDRDAYHIKVNDKLSVYYDAETGLKVKQTNKSAAPDGTIIEQSMYFSNYKEVNGVLVPFSYKMNLGPQSIDFTMTEILINEGVTEGDFN